MDRKQLASTDVINFWEKAITPNPQQGSDWTLPNRLTDDFLLKLNKN